MRRLSITICLPGRWKISEGSIISFFLDIIGHGQSRKTKKGDGIEKMSVWIREILDAEKDRKKIHLVGISLGAVLAQDFANYYPGM